MVNKGVIMLLALAFAVMIGLPAMADGNETMANETGFAVLARENGMFLPDGVEALTPDTVPELNPPTVVDPNPVVMDMNASSAMDWDPDEPDVHESYDYVYFPAEDNYIFQGRIYTFVWTSDFPGSYVSIGIMPAETNESITWMFIGEDRPYDNRLEFCAPFLNEGVYRTVVVIDGEGEQQSFFGDTFFIEKNQVYVPPQLEPPELLVKPTAS